MGVDIVIVGWGILKVIDLLSEVERYWVVVWKVYMERIV